ncbi:disease resistance protein RPV1-like [Lotus japonicus]|uniref:disease resistance protein RPV1-like n=1 Tax=Lotus japonicus TaxID=34305 RepID=UPI0025881367|nr:disease resistance protein RPV1-like [Lotus japonicus]
MLGSSSSSDMAPSPPKHDLFLSFRGEDTRDNFTSHLYAQLCSKNIETFIDNRLARGDEISLALYTAIEDSMIYVIVFSEHYASSSWCLDELVKILECRKKYGREVIPVFYKVDPSNVRHQRGSYADAFVKHELRFKDEVTRRWKDALAEAAGLSGWDSQVTRPESILVADIVEDILRKLDRSFSSDNQGMVGMDNHVALIQSLLHLESEAVRIIGIWGMGGIGKTAIASAVYHKMATQFSSSSFVLNVHEEIEREGVHRTRNRYLSELLKKEGTSSGLRLSFDRLQRKKVLLILDDVKKWGPVKELIGGRDNFGRGSRIVLTSRDMQVLKNCEADEIYEVKEMNVQDSLQLFSLNAFKQTHPIKTYMGLSEKVLNYAKGIPLALKVLGSFLYGRTREAWESELLKLERLPDLDIFNVLKLSFDGLDDEQKDIFLDIACFYRGHIENMVAQTLDSCGFSADIGLDVLKDRCLIYILEGRIVMHDLIQEMGKEVVRQQCVNNPAKRSRLWKDKEVCHVLRQNKGTDAIQCIYLDTCKIKTVQLHSETFRKMHNLRMLQFYKSSDFWQGSNLVLPTFLDSLPDELRILRWDGFPQRSLPLQFFPENLVKLDMRHSHLEQLWEGDKDLPNLKRLDLSYSWKLIRIPDLSLCPNIEEIILSHCKCLIQVHSSSFLSKLKCLYLNGCVELRSLNLPSNILSTSSGLVVLCKCSRLEEFLISGRTEVVQSYGTPRCDGYWGAEEIFHYAKVNLRLDAGEVFTDAEANLSHGNLIQFNAKGYMKAKYCSDTFDPIVSIREPVDGIHLLNMKVMRETMPSLFPSLNELCWLDISDCESLTSLPIDICKLKFLRRLYLRGCSNLENFPEIEDTMENLKVLILDETAIKKLPSSLHRFVGLEELSLHNCPRLEIIPSSIGSLTKLCKLRLTCCESLETFPSSIFNLKLTKLDLHGCTMLKTFPEILEPAESFAHINLTKTAIKELPSSLDNLIGLRTLRLNLCSDLESLPNSIANLSLLSELDCSGCGKLTKIPNDIGCLSSLREWSLHDSGVVSLPESVAHLSSLKSLDLSDCKKLECIPKLPPYLKQLLAFDCPSIRRVMSNSRFELPSGSKEVTFKFHFTNSQELDAVARSNIVAAAWLRMTEEAYRSVFFCFPGSAVPQWFPYRCEGHSVTASKDSLNWFSDNRLIGFALCVVLQIEDMDDINDRTGSLPYELKFEYGDGMKKSLNHDELKSHFYWKRQVRTFVQDHTFLWKHHLDSASIRNILSDAPNLNFKIHKYEDVYLRSSHTDSLLLNIRKYGKPYSKPAFTVKECGICPLYAKEKRRVWRCW